MKDEIKWLKVSKLIESLKIVNKYTNRYPAIFDNWLVIGYDKVISKEDKLFLENLGWKVEFDYFSLEFRNN